MLLSYITKRLLAYFLDCILIGLLIGALSMSPLNPKYDEKEEYNLEYQDLAQGLVDKYSNIDESNETEVNEYLNETVELTSSYAIKSTKLSIYETIITIVVTLGYFAILPFFLEGMTLGKKIMKIKICSYREEKVSFWMLFIRTVILFGLPFNVLNLMFAYIMDKKMFMMTNAILNLSSYALSIAIIVTTLGRKDNRGLHDLISGTKVIEGS